MAASTTNRALTQYVADTVSGLFIRDVPDWTVKQRRTDTPFINKIRRDPGPAVPMLKAEFGWGSPDPVADQLNEALDTTETGVDVDNGAYFQVGHIIKVDAELMRVVSISTNTLTVIRAYNGDLTTGDTHLDDAPVSIVGIAMLENADDPLSPVTQGELDYNYHSLMQMGFQFSERARVTPTYETKGRGDRFQLELKKKMQHTAPVLLERACLFSTRNLGSTTAASSFGGLMQSSYVTTRTSLSSAPLTEYDLLEALNTGWNLVGGEMLGTTIMTSMFTKRVINSWYNGTRQSGPRDSKMSLTWDSIETDLGTFNIDVNYQFDSIATEKDNLYVLNYDDFALRPYASSTGWQTGKRATDGPYHFGFLRGDWTLIAQNPDSRVHLHTYSTTASDYAGFA